MKSRLPLFLVLLLILSCQIIPTPPPLRATQPVWMTPRVVTPQTRIPSESTVTRDVASSSPPTISLGTPDLATTFPTATFPPGELPPFPYSTGKSFADIEEVNWDFEKVAYVTDVPLPVSLDQIENREVIAGLTSRQQSFLANHGFVVLHSQEAQFLDIRERVSLRYGQPYFLTTDAALHALNLTLDELSAALEREELLPHMATVMQVMLSMVDSYLPLVRGTSLESDTLMAAAFLGVALRLFDPQAALWPYMDRQVTDQVAQILAGRGIEVSTLIPDFIDDFESYHPTGHYAGDPHLEGYFRGMTWLNRVHFDLQSRRLDPISQIRGINSVDNPSRLPLVLTLALRQAHTSEGSAALEWGRVQEVLDFLVGPNLDLGPAEYAGLMDQIYGRGITVIDLFDESRWQAFQTLAPVLPSAPISSVFLKSLQDIEIGRGWRFMGRRFNLDNLILQNLVYDRVGTVDKMRETASGLDVMAAFGSSAALKVLENAGDTAYTDYIEQMGYLQGAVQAQSEGQWHGTFFNSWMYALIPKLSTRDEKYPYYMRTSAWSYKDLNSSLGGWVDVEHDTVTYSNAPETTYDGGTLVYRPDPGYVEPDPLVFYRQAQLAMAITEGLSQRGFVGVFSTDPDRLSNLLLDMLDLGDRLQRLGDVAAKELAGIPLEESDLSLIQAPLGPSEERAFLNRASRSRGVGDRMKLPPMEAVMAVEGSSERILQLGVGEVDRIYVVLPLDGKLQIAQGGVFSFYEFLQPRSWPLSDEEWRQLLHLSTIEQPAWVELFSLPDGNPVDVLAFRIGDTYRITPAGAMLNMHESPSRVARILRKLQPGERLIIVDGPVLADSMTWWKFKLDIAEGQPVEGWVVENQEWYERASEP